MAQETSEHQLSEQVYRYVHGKDPGPVAVPPYCSSVEDALAAASILKAQRGIDIFVRVAPDGYGAHVVLEDQSKHEQSSGKQSELVRSPVRLEEGKTTAWPESVQKQLALIICRFIVTS